MILLQPGFKISHLVTTTALVPDQVCRVLQASGHPGGLSWPCLPHQDHHRGRPDHRPDGPRRRLHQGNPNPDCGVPRDRTDRMLLHAGRPQQD